MAFEIVAQLIGALIVAGTLWSAMLTVVVPRAERPRITRYHFKLIGVTSRNLGGRISDPIRRDAFNARLAPLALVTLSFVWVAHIVTGFALVFWGRGVGSFREAMVLSGSSLTTLGIRDADDGVSLILTTIEALIGLGLVGLMISYLPTIYNAYLDREIAVARLEIRAGRPAHPLTFLVRSYRIGWLGVMDTVWSEWEEWFLRIEETHTTHTSLSFFRSAYYGRSWLVAAGTVLDAAALMQSTIAVDPSARAALCLRSGFTTLGHLADIFVVDHPIDPSVDTCSLSIDRSTFDELCNELEQAGVPLKDDRDRSWHDFAGWRVNYEASLLGLSDYLRISAGEWFGEGKAVPSADFSQSPLR